MAITMESIAEKLGFDPLNPPIRIPKNLDEELYIDDNTPSPYSVLTDEESTFLFKVICRMIDDKKLKAGDHDH